MACLSIQIPAIKNDQIREEKHQLAHPHALRFPTFICFPCMQITNFKCSQHFCFLLSKGETLMILVQLVPLRLYFCLLAHTGGVASPVGGKCEEFSQDLCTCSDSIALFSLPFLATARAFPRVGVAPPFPLQGHYSVILISCIISFCIFFQMIPTGTQAMCCFS